MLQVLNVSLIGTVSKGPPQGVSSVFIPWWNEQSLARFFHSALCGRWEVEQAGGCPEAQEP